MSVTELIKKVSTISDGLIARTLLANTGYKAAVPTSRKTIQRVLTFGFRWPFSAR